MQDLKIIFEDDNFMVIDKPVGLVVNRSDTQKGKTTLQDLLPEVESSDNEDFASRSGIVHRLDKDTSGLLIVAKTEQAFVELQNLFKQKDIQKTYFALVFGEFADYGEKIEIDAPVGRNPNNREKFAVVADGKPAFTEIYPEKLVGKYKDDLFSLVKCKPNTGRTHQIRVHLTAIQHPVAGDKMYSGKTRSKRYADKFKRQMLHAAELEFEHPFTQERLHLKSDLPEDMKVVIESI